jgi:hypothetical protein
VWYGLHFQGKFVKRANLVEIKFNDGVKKYIRIRNWGTLGF